MLIEFSVANFRSFKERATLSMEASSDDWLEETQVATVASRRLLRSAAVYGANASGKSNLIRAMAFFRLFVQDSSKNSQLGDRIPVAPFRLQAQTEKEPSHFEVVFLLGNVRYRYGFEATPERVTAEWLFSKADSIRETRLFTREGDQMDLGDFREGHLVKDLTRPNALLLSVAAQFNGTVAGAILGWIQRLNVISGIDDSQVLAYTLNLLALPEYADRIAAMVRDADVGIEALRRKEISAEQVVSHLPKGLPDGLRELLATAANQGAFAVTASHRRFDSEGKDAGLVEFDFQSEESAGTQKLVAMSGPFLQTLSEGAILLVDELEARLHPLLTRALVDLFASPANRRNAQLIYATHDDGLLESKRIRRDQVWFVEKDRFGASKLFSLDEIKGVRKEAKFAKEYLLGQFGGVPRLGDLMEGIPNGH